MPSLCRHGRSQSRAVSYRFTPPARGQHPNAAIDPVVKFELFGAQHLVAFAMTCAIGAVVPLILRGRLSPGRETLFRRVLAVGLLAYLLVNVVSRTLLFDLPLREHLPLHLCGASIFLGAIMLWRHSYRLYEVVYFWGIGGGLAALATPDLPVAFPHPFFVLFFFGHGLSLFIVFYATFVMGFRPRARSVGVALVATAAYAALIFPLNFWLGSNYLYLARKPERPSPLDWLGPWPEYLIGLLAIAALAIVLCYVPFALVQRADGDERQAGGRPMR